MIKIILQFLTAIVMVQANFGGHSKESIQAKIDDWYKEKAEKIEKDPEHAKDEAMINEEKQIEKLQMSIRTEE